MINSTSNYVITLTTINEVPCLTLAVNGSVGACFYQETPFIATADVAILIPKTKLNSDIGLYLATFLRKEGETKYSYGRKIDMESLSNTRLHLPVKDGLIDYPLIESYMGNIKGKYKVKR